MLTHTPHAYTHTHIHGCVYTCTHNHTHMCTDWYMFPHGYTHMHPRMHGSTSSYRYTHARTEQAVRFCSGSSSGGGPRPPGRAAGVQGPGDAVCGDVPTCPLKSPCQNRSPPTTQATEVRAAGSNTHPQSPLLSSLSWEHVALLGFCVWGPEGLLL